MPSHPRLYLKLSIHLLSGHPRLLPRVRCLAHGQSGDGFLLGGWAGGASLPIAICLLASHETSVQQQMAQQVLTQFQESPDAWTRVPDILERSSFPQTKVRPDPASNAFASSSCAVHRSANPGEADHHEVEISPRGPASRYVSILRRVSAGLNDRLLRNPELYCWCHGEGCVG